MAVRRNMIGVAAYNAEQNRQVRESICGALGELVKQKAYDDISVSELCRKAGVSRSAFYGNFGTKEDVFREVVRHFITEINEKIEPLKTRNSREWYEKFFRLVEQNADEYRIILSGEGLQEKYLEVTNEIILDHEWVDEKEAYRRLAFNGAIQNVAFRWIGGGCAQSAETVAAWCWECLE